MHIKFPARILGATLLAGLFAATAAALPASFPGSPDPTYGVSGAYAYSVKNGYEQAYAIAPTPDGKWLVSGSAQSAGLQDGSRYLLRLQGDGRVDTGFGTQGVMSAPGSARMLVVQASGKIVIADQVPTGGMQKAVLRRLLANGTADAAFGTSGGATTLQSATAALPYHYFQALDVDAQGRILGAAGLLANDLNAQRGEAWRFSADGAPDVSFGSQGRVTFDDVGPYLQLMQVRAQPDGKIVIAAWCQANRDAFTRACVIRLNADGSRDASFGPNGVRDIAAPINTSYVLYELRIAPDGKIYAAGSNFRAHPATAFVMRLNADGTMDAGYGNAGIAKLTFPGDSAYVFGVRQLPDGRQVLIGFNDQGSGAMAGYVARLTAAGKLDPGFGVGGVSAAAMALPHSFQDGALLADGSILAVGQRQNAVNAFDEVDSLLVRYVGVETVGTVTEFYNAGLNHYFITADPVEAAAIDGGAAGPGWTRTGKTFKSGGPNRVCRFYGNPEIVPATGTRRGPNGHFYTIEAAECAAVKTDAGWKFESYDFSGWLRTAATCAAGTVPVYRAYNGRFAQNDSNHRYTIDQAVYSGMLAAGWSGEGAVFCAPQ